MVCKLYLNIQNYSLRVWGSVLSMMKNRGKIEQLNRVAPNCPNFQRRNKKSLILEATGQHPFYNFQNREFTNI